MYSLNIARCQHIKINGTQCGSPALRRNRFCYFHKRWREHPIVLNSARSRQSKASFDLPVLEDANSNQVALMQVMRLLLTGQIEQKTASLLLYGLQTASSNLRQTGFEPLFKQTQVIDPKTVDQTPLGENIWDNEDFEEEDEEESEDGPEPEIKTEPLPERAVAAMQTLGFDIQAVADDTVPSRPGPACTATTKGAPFLRVVFAQGWEPRTSAYPMPAFNSRSLHFTAHRFALTCFGRDDRGGKARTSPHKPKTRLVWATGPSSLTDHRHGNADPLHRLDDLHGLV